MTEEERSALVKQLLALVARLEEEMFQSETHKFEAEVQTTCLKSSGLVDHALRIQMLPCITRRYHCYLLGSSPLYEETAARNPVRSRRQAA